MQNTFVKTQNMKIMQLISVSTQLVTLFIQVFAWQLLDWELFGNSDTFDVFVQHTLESLAFKKLTRFFYKKNSDHHSFFITLRNSKDCIKLLGINTISFIHMGTIFSSNFQNSGEYTGYCFRWCSLHFELMQEWTFVAQDAWKMMLYFCYRMIT